MAGPVPNQQVPSPMPGGSAPVSLASSAPSPEYVPQEPLSPSQLPLPPENAPVMGQGQPGQQQESPAVLQQRLAEKDQFIGRLSNEVGTLRDQFFTMQQMMLQQQQQAQMPAQPAPPPVDPERERAQREYEMLNPIVQQRIAAAGDEADEGAIWNQVMGEYQIALAAAQMQMAPIIQQQQQAQQLYNRNFGAQLINQRVNDLFQRGGYQTLQPQQFLQMVAPSINMDQFLQWPEQEQLRVLEMAANDLEMRNIRNAQAQQQLASQYGMQPNGQPVQMPMGSNPYNMTVNGYPVHQLAAMGAPQQQPYPPQPMPYQGQYNLMNQVPSQQVPNTMSPTLPQANPQQQAEYLQTVQYFQGMMGLPPERAARAAQHYLAGRR